MSSVIFKSTYGDVINLLNEMVRGSFRTRGAVVAIFIDARGYAPIPFERGYERELHERYFAQAMGALGKKMVVEFMLEDPRDEVLLKRRL